MFKNRSLKKLLDQLDRLVAASKANTDSLPGLQEQERELQEQLERVKAAKYRQQILTENRQQATREFKREVDAACDMASRLRSLVKGTLGPRDPRLELFGMRPNGKPRIRRPKPKLFEQPAPLGDHHGG
ncbi:MAG TPA: hypothetical protein VGG03_19890 [Thermoanaerobaculia bacterium]|jgi:hypothetical protein